MPVFHVTKSIVIDKPIDQVYASVRDFRQWQVWSPWLRAEPGCEPVHADDGESYSWDGKIVGSGEMAITVEVPSKSIDYRLSFFKPWKSLNTTRFEFSEEGAGTKVTWSMVGSLPIYLFFLKGMMTAFIGMDYARGLRMLKDFLETGSVPSRLDFEGAKSGAGFSYVGIRSSCRMDEMATEMARIFEKLKRAMEVSGIEPSGAPFSVYHKWQMTKGIAQFTTGFPVASAPPALPEGLVSGVVPSSDVYVVKHTGPYRHLGNAWSAGMMHAQAKVFAKDKKFEPYEVYESSSKEVPENELVTVVKLGVK